MHGNGFTASIPEIVMNEPVLVLENQLAGGGGLQLELLPLSLFQCPEAEEWPFPGFDGLSTPKNPFSITKF